MSAPVEHFTAALKYRARGFNVIPFWFHGGKKVPAIDWKEFQTKQVPEAELRAACSKGGIAGLAVILGPSSDDLVCRDFEIESAYENWSYEYPDYAKPLPCVQTPRPGHHDYTRWQGIGSTKLGDGELRGLGGLAVLPPSRVGSKAYTWLNPLPPGQLLLTDPATIGLAQAWADTIEQLEQAEQLAAVKSICSMDEVVRLSLPVKIGGTNTAEMIFARGVLNVEIARGEKVLKRKAFRPGRLIGDQPANARDTERQKRAAKDQATDQRVQPQIIAADSLVFGVHARADDNRLKLVGGFGVVLARR